MLAMERHRVPRATHAALVTASGGSGFARVITTELNDLALPRHSDHRAYRLHDCAWLAERDDVTRTFGRYLTSSVGQRDLVTLQTLPLRIRAETSGDHD